MGLVYADIGLSNPSNPDLDPIDLRMLVDSGSMWLVIPQHVANQLGLAELEKREVTLADGARKLVPYVGPVRVRFGRRNAFTGALVMGDEPLLGAIPMEDMDVLIHPLTRQLIANPANPNIPGSMAVGVRPAPSNIFPDDSFVVDAQTIAIEQFRALDVPFEKDNEALVAAARTVTIPGMVLEFGVFQGKTLRLLAEVFPDRPVYGFDSFEGLPEAWERSPASTYEAGHFAVKALPKVPDHVALIKGFFCDTLPDWLAVHTGPVAFLHVDGDLYSSAKDVLWPLNDRIGPGCVIVFDELSDWQDSGVYPFWPDGEWKALLEWMAAFDRKIRILNRGPQYNAALVVVQ